MISSGRSAQRFADVVRGVRDSASGAPTSLCRYRVDDAMMTELEELLSSRLADPNPNLSRAEAAAFVLYCAHHFARSYTGGQWTWAIAKGTIDPAERLSPPVLYEVVERGLSGWNRSVYWNGRHHEYLYTIGREGGLPLGVLTQERGEGLRTFLQRLLTSVETSTIAADEAAVGLAHHLPPQLRQPEILRLAAELVQRLAELRAAVPSNASPSMAWMDDHQVDWRDRLPVTMSDAAASALISGLIQQARPPTRERHFALVTRLLNGRLQRTLQTPKRVKADDLLGVERATLPSRLRISLTNGVSTSTRAMATHLGGGDYVIERLPAETLEGPEWFTTEVRLVVGLGERDLSSWPLPGGEPTGHDSLPWVFDDAQTGTWELAARGSYTSASSSLLVIHRADVGTWNAPKEALERLREEPLPGWVLTRLSGAARWKTEQDVCEIEAGSIASAGYFELKGRSERIAGTGSFVWRGCPEVHSRTGHGVAMRVPDSYLEWRPVGGAQSWQRLGPQCLGEVALRVRDGARTLYRTHVTVAPADLMVELFAHRATAGEIRVRSARLTGVRVLTIGVEATTLSPPPSVSVEVSSAAPPLDLNVELQFGAAARVPLRLPFPSEFCGFVSVEGDPLPARGRIGLDMLSRWVARAVSSARGHQFVLEVQTELGPRTLAELPETAPGLAELPLSRIRTALEACLSGTRNIDEFVSLRVVRRTGVVLPSVARAEAHLGWHEAQLNVELDNDAAFVELDRKMTAGLADWQVRDFRILARPLHAPAADPVQLEGDARSGWIFSPGEERRWLLTGWVGHALMTRPRMIPFAALPSHPPPDDELGAPTIEHAMRAATLDERKDTFAVVYKVLSRDYGHPDWRRVDEFLRTLHELPPPTYDVVCALAAAKPAAVAALLRQPKAHFDAVWTGLDRLGVSWHTIPIGVWLGAARLGHDFAFNSPHAGLVGGKDALLRQLLPALFEPSDDRPRFFGTLLAALHDLGFPDDANARFCLQQGRSREGRHFLRHQLREACIDLRRRAELTGDRFPPLRLNEHACCPDVGELMDRFDLADQVGFTWGCLAAPLVAADIMVNGHAVSGALLDDLRLFRAFDEEWFEFAHAVALTVSLGLALENDNDCIESTESQLLGVDG